MGKEKVCIFALPKGLQCWSDGRVARHSSAKAATAVRIRFRPQKGALHDGVAHFLFFYA